MTTKVSKSEKLFPVTTARRKMFDSSRILDIRAQKRKVSTPVETFLCLRNRRVHRRPSLSLLRVYVDKSLFDPKKAVARGGLGVVSSRNKKPFGPETRRASLTEDAMSKRSNRTRSMQQ
jgi:hypothetical protein